MDIMKIEKKYTSLTNAMEVIYKQEGIFGFFKGLSTTSILIPLNYVIYFDLYERAKIIVRDITGEQNTLKCFAIPSIVSGFFTSLILCPLWVIRTRTQADIYRCLNNKNPAIATNGINGFDRTNIFATLQKIYRTVFLHYNI